MAPPHEQDPRDQPDPPDAPDALGAPDAPDAPDARQRLQALHDLEIVKEEESEAAAIDHQASYQDNPAIDDPATARAHETGTARRAEQAAGLPPHRQHEQDAERAVERGVDRERK